LTWHLRVLARIKHWDTLTLLCIASLDRCPVLVCHLTQLSRAVIAPSVSEQMHYGSLLLNLLQGTQSANPHNDYCQHFVDTGERPQNFIRDVGRSSTAFLAYWYNINKNNINNSDNKQLRILAQYLFLFHMQNGANHKYYRFYNKQSSDGSWKVLKFIFQFFSPWKVLI